MHELYDPMVFWEAEEPALILRNRHIDMAWIHILQNLSMNKKIP